MLTIQTGNEGEILLWIKYLINLIGVQEDGNDNGDEIKLY